MGNSRAKRACGSDDELDGERKHWCMELEMVHDASVETDDHFSKSDRTPAMLALVGI
jgi:hypothetical protein